MKDSARFFAFSLYNDVKNEVKFDAKKGNMMNVKIMPVSELRRRTSEVIQTAQEEAAVYITQHGRPIVVLVDYERYETLRRQSEEATAEIPPGGYTEYLAGLHQEIWAGVDTDAYIQEERDAWEVSTTP